MARRTRHYQEIKRLIGDRRIVYATPAIPMIARASTLIHPVCEWVEVMAIHVEASDLPDGRPVSMGDTT